MIYIFIYLQLTPVGTTIFRSLSAVDTDSGRNGDVDFNIVPGDGGPVCGKMYNLLKRKKKLKVPLFLVIFPYIK